MRGTLYSQRMEHGVLSSGNWCTGFCYEIYGKVNERIGAGKERKTLIWRLGETTERSSNSLWLKSGENEWKIKS